MTYIPKPLNTSGVELSDDLKELVEKLAENVHDVWAIGRIQEGYLYGKFRDDVKKTHPGLVPYSELSDSEKAYDIKTAEGTIKSLIVLGYNIK